MLPFYVSWICRKIYMYFMQGQDFFSCFSEHKNLFQFFWMHIYWRIMTATVCLRESQGETIQKSFLKCQYYLLRIGRMVVPMHKNFLSFVLQTRKFSRKPCRGKSRKIQNIIQAIFNFLTLNFSFTRQNRVNFQFSFFLANCAAVSKYC